MMQIFQILHIPCGYRLSMRKMENIEIIPHDYVDITQFHNGRGKPIEGLGTVVVTGNVVKQTDLSNITRCHVRKLMYSLCSTAASG